MQANIFLREKSEKMLNEKVQVKMQKCSVRKNGNGKSQMNKKNCPQIESDRNFNFSSLSGQ